MFYAHIILAKKGPLARVWLAAHWDKKITKAHVFETNIEKSVEGIMQPKVKLALRTSGHLLLGVVRIYSRKAKYLLADCNEAFVKIKMAFRPGMVDLPEGHREANVNAITLPEVFHDFDTALPELNDIDIEAQFSINQSRADEITMREDYGSLSISLHDDGFGDVGFDNATPDMVREQLDSTLNDQLFEDELIPTIGDNPTNIRLNEPNVSETRLDGDGFGDEFGQPELFGDELFGEPPRLDTENQEILEPIANVNEESNDNVSEHFAARDPSPDSSCEEPVNSNKKEGDADKEEINAVNQHETADENLEQSTLLQNEDESFALAPVDASAYKGVTKTKRKRKLIVDEIKNISGEEMKAQLANTSDIVTTLDLAPPTKRLMYWKETGGVEKLFSLPSRTIPARALFLNYHRNLISHFTQLEDFTCLGPSDILALDHVSNENDSSAIIQNKRGRKRKFDVVHNNILSSTDINAEITTQNLSVPETVREQENLVISNDSLKINNLITNESAQAPEPVIFDSCPSPGPLFNMNDISNIDNLESLADLNFTPGNLSHGIDAIDDFNHGGLTPVNLNHGQMTPRHPDIETIESIPNLPVDQISSILNEAENIPDNSTKEGSGNINKSSDLGRDWNDYTFSPSIEIQNNIDEQMENETSEQFEERVLNKRAAQLFYVVKNRIVKQDCVLLSELTIKNSRKQAAQKFYSLLVLKKFRALNISQSSPYADIVVTRGQLFENPKL